MAIRDLLNMFSSSQAITASAIGQNVIDLGAAYPIGVGEPMAVVFNVEVDAIINDADEDYMFDLEVGSDEGVTANRKLLGRRVFETTPTAPAEDAALLKAGFQFVIPVPPTGVAEAGRYMAIRSTLAGATPGITFSAYLVPLSFIVQANLVAWSVEIL